MYKSARGYNHPPTSFVSKTKTWIFKKLNTGSEPKSYGHTVHAFLQWRSLQMEAVYSYETW